MKTQTASRGQALVTWGAMLAGIVAYAIVAAIVGPAVRASRSGMPGPLGEISVGVAALSIPLSRFLPSRARMEASAPPEVAALYRATLACAPCELAGLFAVTAWMVTDSVWGLVGMAIAAAGLLAWFPSEARWRRLMPSAARAGRPMIR